ncbi:MAG: hypothetical protein J0I69_02695 [Altererythrobacter sp.]|nr:hypothetical protein [Altererythrobacter sp.]OJU60928.1 MAG: hypothetical protein BGO08_12445 [Altererythrobacter sp. 66-12]
MAIIYSTAAKTARMQAVIDLIDAGSGPGVLEIGTANMELVLATLTLADPSGTAAAGVLTFDTDPAIEDPEADASGVAAAARFKDSNGNVIISGLTVGLKESGADIELDNTNIAAGQEINLKTGEISHTNGEA